MIRRQHLDKNTLAWRSLLLLVLVCTIFGIRPCYYCQAVSLVHLVVGSSLNAPKYPGQVATFGNQQPRKLFVPNLNLILPPNNESQLCRFPDEGVEWDEATQAYDVYPTLVNEEEDYNSEANATVAPQALQEEYSDYSHGLVDRQNMSVALFVGYGECLPSRKAKVALALRQNFTRYGTITHLIIYNNDYNHMDELHTLTSYIHDDVHDSDEFNDISILFISTRSGHDILETIQMEQQRQRIANPVLMDQGNEFWYLPVSMLEPPPWELHNTDYGHYTGSGSQNYGFDPNDPYNDNWGEPQQYPPPHTQSNTGIPHSDDFYWFRLIVFSLLVVSPCFRAAYLWYAGGARIRFRYNDNGRVVGLQYIPPMPYWFAPRPGDEDQVHPASRMTREQVLALPEIVYQGSADASSEFFVQQQQMDTTSRSDKNGKEEPEASTSSSSGQDPPKITDPTNATTSDESPSLTVSGTESSSGPDIEESDLEAAADSDDDQQPPSNPCDMHSNSTCSICIDDFETGERLRMLPRCRHIFHTDCILPWLTERQGCCPLCKTEVIEPSEIDEEGNEDRFITNPTTAANSNSTPSDPFHSQFSGGLIAVSLLPPSPPPPPPSSPTNAGDVLYSQYNGGVINVVNLSSPPAASGDIFQNEGPNAANDASPPAAEDVFHNEDPQQQQQRSPPPPPRSYRYEPTTVSSDEDEEIEEVFRNEHETPPPKPKPQRRQSDSSKGEQSVQPPRTDAQEDDQPPAFDNEYDH